MTKRTKIKSNNAMVRAMEERSQDLGSSREFSRTSALKLEG
jgi:hypothetical protein